MLLWPIRLAFRLVSLVVLAIVVYLVVSGVQVALGATASVGTAGLRPAEAIVVLPAAIVNGAPSGDFLGRLQEALACYQAHVAPRVVVAGTAGAPSEPGTAEVGR